MLTDTEKDPVKFSFLMAGEPERKLDLDDTPTEEELRGGEMEEPPAPNNVNEDDVAEEDWRSSRSIGSIPDRKQPEPEEGEEGEEPKATKAEAPPAEEKPKKKVKFKKPFKEPKNLDIEPPQYQPEQPETTAQQPQQNEVPKQKQQSKSSLSEQERQLIERLPPDAKESIEFWEQAEEVDPKYKGYAKHQLNYIRQLQSKIQEFKKADPHTPVEENEDYIDWVRRNKPSAPRNEIKRIEKEILINEAKKRISSEVSKETEELKQWKAQQEREKEIAKVMPKLQERSATFTRTVIDQIAKVAEEPMALFNEVLKKEGNPQKALQAMTEEFPEESAIITRNHQVAKMMADEFLKLRSGIAAPDIEKNQLHQQIAERVLAQERAIMTKPELKQYRIRDGKSFVPAHQFRQLPPDQRQKHWTFSDEEVLNFLSAEAVNRTRNDLELHQQRVQKLLSRYGKEKSTPRGEDQRSRNPNPPRHKGTDSPSSSQRAEVKDSAPSKSPLLNWDY